MRKWLVILLVFVFSSVVLAEDFEVGTSLDFFSQYIWRGQQFNPEAVFQPSVSVSKDGFTGVVWGNMDLTDWNHEQGNITEVDFGLDYSGDAPFLSGFGYSVGFVHFDFPNLGIEDTTEVFAGLTWDVFLNPSFTWNYDVDEVKNGSYFAFGLSHAFPELFELSGKKVGLELASNLGFGNSSYNQGYWGVKEENLNDLTVSASLPFEVCDWNVAPLITYAMVLSGDLRRTNSYCDSHNLFAGVSFSRQF